MKFTPEIVPQSTLDADWHWLNVDAAHNHIYKRLKQRDLQLDEIIASLLPSNRRVPYVKTYRTQPDGSVITSCCGNRHKYPLLEYVISDYRHRVYYHADQLDYWLEDYVYPRCKPRTKRPAKSTAAKTGAAA